MAIFFVCLIRDQCLKEFLLDSHLGSRVQMSVFLGVGNTHEFMSTLGPKCHHSLLRHGKVVQYLHHICLWVFQCETAQ